MWLLVVPAPAALPEPPLPGAPGPPPPPWVSEAPSCCERGREEGVGEAEVRSESEPEALVEGVARSRARWRRRSPFLLLPVEVRNRFLLLFPVAPGGASFLPC